VPPSEPDDSFSLCRRPDARLCNGDGPQLPDVAVLAARERAPGRRRRRRELCVDERTTAGANGARLLASDELGERSVATADGCSANFGAGARTTNRRRPRSKRPLLQRHWGAVVPAAPASLSPIVQSASEISVGRGCRSRRRSRSGAPSYWRKPGRLRPSDDVGVFPRMTAKEVCGSVPRRPAARTRGRRKAGMSDR